MLAYISIPDTDLMIIFGGLLFLLFDYYSSNTRIVNSVKLGDLTQEEVLDLCNYFIERLSQEYSVNIPTFEITNYKEDDLNVVRYSNGRTLAYFTGEENKISLQLKVLIEEGCSLSDMIECIAHEFQHYLDAMSFDTPKQWMSAYEKNVNYYEYKANRFASKKLKKLLKNFLTDSVLSL